ncbi:MAG: translation elongation factor Ts [Paracoccaceae bacterium]|nr:translation elongation factor Ts [Paracoccaceae bacterium]
MSVTAALVKELRDTSGAGMMDAKKALIESGGDMDAAVDWLRTKGLAKAAKKSDRTAAEGLVCLKVNASSAVALEVNSETDFVAKNAEFQDLVLTLTDAAESCDSLDGLREVNIHGKSVETLVAEKIATIGENMSVRRLRKLVGKNISMYVHNSVSANMGKIGVLVSLSEKNDDLGRQIAMHIAATNPVSLSVDDLSDELIELEKIILTEQAKDSGKPDNIIENMIKGRLKKYFEEVTLLNQKFVINQDITVDQAIKAAGTEILDFVRLEVGEGIDKKDENFAAEVAKTMNN